ncbi:MAG TPA: NAD(P)-dependent oxidoreductase [Planctomycetota bacterium]|nr:NAD(P)-dependent oxidoreductase [Planctomycetota bacterium]
MARVLVTGGTGFLGSALVRRLARAGDDVLVLHRHVSDLRRLQPVRERVRFADADLAEPASWSYAVREFAPERVFHLAWYAEPGKYLTDHRENLKHLHAGAAFVREVLALRPRHFVCAGTCFEYDTSGSEPLREDHTPERPLHIYSACKLALKHAALRLAADAAVPLVWARVFYLYGPYEDPRRLVPFVAARLQKGEPVQLRSHGRQVRDFLHVDDVASGIDAAAALGRPGVVNIASGEGITVRELTTQIARAFGREELLSFAPDDTPLDEPRTVVGDAARLRGLGWRPRTRLCASSLEVTEPVANDLGHR